MRNRCFRTLSAASLVVVVSFSFVSNAEVRLPAIFGDHMVLQADEPLPVWGWADPGESIMVAIGGQTKQAKADERGAWRVTLDPIEAGERLQLIVRGDASDGEPIMLTDILVGEVWICSGQSNMEWPLRATEDAESAIAEAHEPELRLFVVTNRTAATPQEDVEGRWVSCNPQTVADFSAVGYYFGRMLSHDLDRPVGLIDSTWGGTPAEAWTSREKLETVDAAAALLARWDDTEEGWPQHRPASLYNAMIDPLAPFAIAGAIWYQGESNATRAEQYGSLFPAMIHDWRERWGQGDFPFGFVQLANFKQRAEAPGDSDWAELREAQLMTLESTPNSGMAVIIDIGDASDIHPRNKKDVGERLAKWALATAYDRDIAYSGPIYTSMRRDGQSIILEFDHVGDGLVSRGDDGALDGFAVAGSDRRFVWADARIEGDTVVVSSPEVSDPVAVRYGWADNPVCTLYNEAGFPASPFRTDDWPGVTDGRR
ncbi:MAG: sialate O-acetylesterase [Phycisphaerales bacterium]